jgi:hypothetical protein
MKSLTVIAAGLGYQMLERNKRLRMAGLAFGSAPSVFPAVTCVAQATLRTGKTPAEHGMVSNGWWSEELRKPLFWEQSSRLVKGDRVWGKNDGVYFFQQSLGEDVASIVSPAPIHKHGGGMVMSCYAKPAGMASVLERLCGKFPLGRYWGPFASAKVGRACISWFEEMTNVHDVEHAYLYLPTLDYAAQKYGPGSRQDQAALKELERELERISDICMRRSCTLKVLGDYEIAPVTEEPVLPNVLLRKEGLFKVRAVGGRAYPDFYQSTSFAMCDHEVCVVCGEDRERAAELLLATGDYEFPSTPAPKPPNNQTILLAKPGSWCGYEWWTDASEAPDFASHVDIHNKPGYDPKELFLFNRGVVRGTHGRPCSVAASER